MLCVTPPGYRRTLEVIAVIETGPTNTRARGGADLWRSLVVIRCDNSGNRFLRPSSSTV